MKFAYSMGFLVMADWMCYHHRHATTHYSMHVFTGGQP